MFCQSMDVAWDTFDTTTSSFGFGSSKIFWSTFLFFGFLHATQAAISTHAVSYGTYQKHAT